MKRTYVDPFTGWYATYLCKVCGLPYPIQVVARPSLPCPECGSRTFTRATVPKDDR